MTGDVSRIRRLDDALVDQIAAGEVVERPASVVKELVENALDAGARSLRVELRDGGASFIAVTDDGIGMTADEARLALERHATSKLRTVDDLARIASFGFRGEALPAIAAVSRLRLRTRTAEAAEGVELRVDGGRLVGEQPAGGPVGTRVEVADLFVHVPARRKFLKRPATEWTHIADWLARSALALPGVRFEIQRDDRPPSIWPATEEPLDRIAAVLGDDEASALLAVEREDDAGSVRAYASAPERTRPNTQGLYLFVNGRPVRDPLLRSAVLQAYRDWLPRGRFPTVVLFLSVPPESVDVNVHPAKWEVRFADAQAIRQLVRRGLRQAIERRSWLAGGEGTGDVVSGETSRVSHTVASAGAVADRGRESRSFEWTSSAGPPVAGRARRAETAGSAGSAGLAGDWTFAGRQSEVFGAAAEPAGDATRWRFGDLRVIGQWLASYLLVESKEGLLLVDQHAAHERVVYERLRAEWLERGVERQGLLAPVVVELEPAAVARLSENSERMERIGIEIEPFGEGSVAVRALPALLGDRDPAALVRELADELEEGGPARAPEGADRVFASLACHAARRAGDRLAEREQQAILEALDTIPWSPTCPHGRPVAVPLSRSEIERRFGRT